jgi:DNA-binding transcriptional MerR regulator
MPYKEKTIEKRYFSIAEVADMLKVNKSLLRFWESEFDSLKPKKSTTGNRLYTHKDIDNLKIIYSLVKEKGYTLDGAKQKLKQQDENVAVLDNKTITTLQKVRAFLKNLEDII